MLFLPGQKLLSTGDGHMCPGRRSGCCPAPACFLTKPGGSELSSLEHTVLASETQHHPAVENTEPTGKQGSSVSGADPVTSLTQLVAARLGSQQEHLHPQLHLQLSFWSWI